MTLSGNTPQCKKQLRQQLRKQRQLLSLEDWQRASEQICRHVADLSLFQDAQTVLAYVSHQQEPSLAQLWQSDVCGYLNPPHPPTGPRRWGFPRCVGQHLSWHVCSTPEDFQRGTYGIPEPRDHKLLLGPGDIDLILVPAVACDPYGFRLGYGGGYYDRLLSHPDWQGIPTLGIIFAFAALPHLPVEPWDQPLMGVCTEEGIQRLQHRSG